MPPSLDSTSSYEDMFLKLTLAKSGKVKGETDDLEHQGEIELAGWSWGMKGSTGMSGAGVAAKATINELQVRKFFDRSSTVLMQALRQNEAVKEAVVAVRKAGGKQHDYLAITIQNGRITSYKVDTEGPRPIENITFSFNKITVEYKQQSADGQLGGAMQYVDDFGPNI